MKVAQPAIDRETVVIGMAQEPDGLGVRAQSTGAAGAVMNPLFCALVEWDEHWRPFPRVVESIPNLDDGSWQVNGDRMVMKYRLRPGYRWHDGTSVTADDVKFGLEFCRDGRVPVVNRWLEQKIEDIRVLSELEFEVHYRELLPHADVFFGTAYGTSFMSRKAYEPFLRDRARMSVMPFSDRPLGNGPYRFVSWDRGHEIRLCRVDEFVEGRPDIARVLFRFYPDSASLWEAQVRGEVDGTDLNNFSLSDMEEIDDRVGEHVATHYNPAIEWEHIDVNLDHPALSDVRVRRALLHAFDREDAVGREFRGRVNVAHTWLGDKYYAFCPTATRHDYAPTRAVRLLEDAGWHAGAGGMRTDAEGNPLSLRLSTIPGNPSRRRIAEAMAGDLARVGVRLEIEELPLAILIGDRLRKRDFELVMLSWVMSPTAPGFGLWHSSQIPAEHNNYAGQNFCGWKNQLNDELLEAILTELDTSRRIELFHRQQELFSDHLPSLPLYFRLHLQTIKRGLIGPRPVGLSGTYLAWNVHQWRWG